MPQPIKILPKIIVNSKTVYDYLHDVYGMVCELEESEKETILLTLRCSHDGFFSVLDYGKSPLKINCPDNQKDVEIAITITKLYNLTHTLKLMPEQMLTIVLYPQRNWLALQEAFLIN